MNPILVVGSTGNVGGHVLSQLLAADKPVRALVRNPQAHFPPQVEVVRGDLTVPESLDPCLEGIDTVFLVWTAPPATVAPAIERFAQYARHIVFLSAPLKTPHPFFQQPNPARTLGLEIERQIEASGLQWTFLRPGMFAGDGLRWWAPQIRSGDTVRWPYLSAPTAPVDERDIAAVAVRALTEDGHHRAEYVLTGPQSLTQGEQIGIIGQTLGRTLRIEEMSPDEARREMSAFMDFGMAPAVAIVNVINMLLGAWAAALGQPALVTSTIAEVTGAPPRTFRNWAADYAAHFRA